MAIPDKMKKKVVISGLIAVVVCGTIFGFGTGMNDATSSSLIGKSSKLNLAIYTSSVVLGAFLASFFAGYFADIIGRKRMLAVGAGFGLVGNTIYMIDSNLWIVCIGRIKVGMCIGIVSAIGPLYLAETCPDELRGVLGACFQLAITMSIFFGAACVFITSDDAWRLIGGLLYIPIVLLLILTFFIPESPRFLVGRDNELAVKLLTDIFNEQEAEKQRDTIIKKRKEKVTWGQIFSKENQKPLTIMTMLAVGQQMTGINVIIYYFSNLIGENIDPFYQKLAFTLIMLWNCMTSMGAIPFINKVGRRRMLIISQSIMCASLGVCGIALFFPKLDILSIIAVCVFILGFESGFGPLFSVVLTEIFGEIYRGKVVSMMMSFQWLLNLVVSIAAIQLANAFQNAYGKNNGFIFFIFMGFSVLTIVYVVLYVPETRGKSFDEINKLMQEGGMVYGKKKE